VTTSLRRPVRSSDSRSIVAIAALRALSAASVDMPGLRAAVTRSVTSSIDRSETNSSPGTRASCSREAARNPSRRKSRPGVEMFWRCCEAMWWLVSTSPSRETNDPDPPEPMRTHACITWRVQASSGVKSCFALSCLTGSALRSHMPSSARAEWDARTLT
jgi:hypothetical protein